MKVDKFSELAVFCIVIFVYIELLFSLIVFKLLY